MSVFLRVKIASLAAEAVIIRREERRWKPRWQVEQDPTFFSLKNHRRLEVRPEARAALLAYGFLRGRSYPKIEATCHEAPALSRVMELVRKYGSLSKDDTRQAVLTWYGEGTLKGGDDG